MSDLLASFGSYVGSKIYDNPDAARKLLLAAYRAKLIQLKRFPEKRLGKSRDLLAVASMRAVIAPLAHPEQSALVSIFTPCELLQSAGIHPMFAEAMASYLTGAKAERAFVRFAEEKGIPETYCSYHKILLGGILSGTIPKPRVIVNTSLACDANNLTFRMAAEHWDLPHFYIDVPYEISDDSIAYTAQQLRELKVFLEDHFKKKIREEDLKSRVACAGRTLKLLNACQEKKKRKYLSNDLTDELYEVFGTHVLLGTPVIEKYAAKLLGELMDAPADSGVRLLWMHTIPYYQKELRNLLNFSERCQIIACDMNYDAVSRMDPEHPYESMAERLVTDSFNGSSARRIARSLEMCAKQEIDGVVYFCHWGCKQTLAAAGNARAMFEAAGIPVLVLDGDGCDRQNTSNGQMATRIEAFLEMLEKKKK